MTSREKLRVGTKLAFGAGDVSAAIVAAINGFFLNAFLLDIAGVRTRSSRFDLLAGEGMGRRQ
jgi:Na+/melibiose symporter-like transporter